jgi:2-oxoglutarate ferredoxin oxidoreductase subunit gamma
MKGKIEIIFAGTGGQGLVTASIILGEAAMESNFEVTQKANYGVTTIGGYVQTDIVMSKESVIYPEVQDPNIILTLTQDAFNKFINIIKNDAVMIFDKNVIEYDGDDKNVIGYEISVAAMESNNPGAVNMSGLGVLIALTKILPNDAIENHILNQNYKDEINKLNLEAYKRGFDLVK